ncbi:Exostosin-like protein [Cynara cardunculus var. scolymus]|uniref:Exostosin-like protein n=1 Tax=Cynara cardunculus var. scolymus TaxID=59895 RepID=A0A103WL01_CYNCS|nr:Exostosin-like protein [Cynara cardunculus var. scolymus]
MLTPVSSLCFELHEPHLALEYTIGKMLWISVRNARKPPTDPNSTLDDKDPDMKIFRPMARDIVSKASYQTYMKSSKYCIFTRGYEVFSPRIVESIYFECVPVIMN